MDHSQILGKEPSSESIFITGVDGFAGGHLRRLARDQGFRVTGTSRKTNSPAEGVYQCNIEDEAELSRIVESVLPDYVVHLAARSHFVQGDPAQVYRTNVIGSRNLLSALSKASKSPKRVLLVSSGNVYGISSQERLKETDALSPINDYSVSKVAMEFLAIAWQSFFEIVVARPFNHIGKGQAGTFLIPKLARAFQKGLPSIEVGNTSAIRDFSDVRDVSRAYLSLLLCAACPVHPINVCTGEGHTVLEIINLLRSITGHHPEVIAVKGLSRLQEIPRLVGDPASLVRVGGYRPKADLEGCLRWILSQ